MIYCSSFFLLFSFWNSLKKGCFYVGFKLPTALTHDNEFIIGYEHVGFHLTLFSLFVYIGGVLKANEAAYAQKVRHVNDHFDQHIPTITNGNHDSMDHLLSSQPRRRFSYAATSYIMSSEAARRLVKLVEDKGFNVPTAYVLMKLLDLVDGCYTAYPYLTLL